MPADDYTDKDKHENITVPHGMACAQELGRPMRRFCKLAISFSIVCILSGGINALGQAINPFGIKLTAKLTDFSGYLILSTAAALTVVCLFSAEPWDIAWLWRVDNFTGTEGAPGVWPVAVGGGMAFLLGLLLPVYTITGYDTSAHTAEETVKASVSGSKRMVSSVCWSCLFGWIMLCSFVLMRPNMEDAARQGWNVFFWGMDSAVNPTIKPLLYIAILASQRLCGLAPVTSASRMLFAFSRDGGILGASKMLATVSPKHRTPVAAIWAAAVLATLFVWLTPHHCGHSGRLDRGVLHGDLPVLVLRTADWTGSVHHRWTEMANDGAVGHRGRCFQIGCRSFDCCDGARLLSWHSGSERLGLAVHAGLHRAGAGDPGRV